MKKATESDERRLREQLALNYKRLVRLGKVKSGVRKAAL